GSVQTLLAPIRRRYLPNMVLAAGPEGTTAPPLLADRPTVDGDPSAYLCRRFVCLEPVTSPEALGEELDRDQIA
ncbi:MAG: hypothetical protein ACKOFX_00165, partial [Solirubrobacterales bacterium]